MDFGDGSHNVTNGTRGAYPVSVEAMYDSSSQLQISAWNTRKSVNPHLFVRSHVAAYFVSLLWCDLMQGALRFGVVLADGLMSPLQHLRPCLACSGLRRER